MAKPPTPPTQNGRTDQLVNGNSGGRSNSISGSGNSNGNGNGNGNGGHNGGGGGDAAAGLDHSLLQPRLAVALGVPRRWHPFLIVTRMLSIAPALWWGIRCALRFLFTEFVLSSGGGGSSRHDSHLAAAPLSAEETRLSRAESSLRLTETLLAMVWCWASAHLSYFFTDSLMSRWLINYTPQATLVRLCTLACVSSYATSWVVHLAGADRDPGLLLPAWISIASILTACYQVTQRRVNIRKETRLSVSVFSYASFISMVALLVHSHYAYYVASASLHSDDYSGSSAYSPDSAAAAPVSNRLPYTDIPIVSLAKRAAEIAVPLFVRLLGVTRELDEL